MNIITRMWHGTTKAEHAEEYLKFLEDIGVQDFHSIAGNLSCKVLRSVNGNVCHFIVATEWDSYESIKKFAGEDYKKARYYPEDIKYLLAFEEHVTHYETFQYSQTKSERS